MTTVLLRALVGIRANPDVMAGQTITLELLKPIAGGGYDLVTQWSGDLNFDEGIENAHPGLAEELLHRLEDHNLTSPDMVRWLGVEFRCWIEEFDSGSPEIIVAIGADPFWRVSNKAESHSYHPELYRFLREIV